MFKKNKSGFMAQIESWLQTEIFPPIQAAHADGDLDELKLATDHAVKAIKEKILESYRNGLAAKPTGNASRHA